MGGVGGMGWYGLVWAAWADVGGMGWYGRHGLTTMANYPWRLSVSEMALVCVFWS
jgi:hypothetical protein